jgi:hypothetical protein
MSWTALAGMAGGAADAVVGSAPAQEAQTVGGASHKGSQPSPTLQQWQPGLPAGIVYGPLLESKNAQVRRGSKSAPLRNARPRVHLPLLFG